MKKIRSLKRYIWVLIHSIFTNNGEHYSPHGVNIKLPKNADISMRYLLARGRPYEEPEARMVERYVLKETNVIELGGCYGIISALIRKKIGPNAKHIIVEADPALAGICNDNANLKNTVNKAEIVIAAVDYSGAKEITFAPGQNAHVGHVALKGEQGFTVPTTTLTEQVSKLPDDDYVLVCDIEGAELDLFENEKKALERANFVILETHPKIYPKKDSDLALLLTAIENLGLVQIEKSGSVMCFASKTAMVDLNLT